SLVAELSVLSGRATSAPITLSMRARAIPRGKSRSSAAVSARTWLSNAPVSSPDGSRRSVTFAAAGGWRFSEDARPVRPSNSARQLSRRILTPMAIQALPTYQPQTPELVRSEFAAKVSHTIDRAQRSLLELQRPDGYWQAALEANAEMNAEYILFQHYMDAVD